MGILDFINRLPTRNELTGSMGEWLTKFYANPLPGALVLHDVLIDGKDGYTSQLDLVMVGNKGIYVVEVKMFEDAKIYGDTQKSKWSYYKHGKKYEIYSPLHQNKKHVEYLKTFLSQFGDLPFYSVITMICDDFKVSGEFDGKTLLCNSLPGMKQGLRLLLDGKEPVIDDARKQEIFDFIQTNQHAGKDARQNHKQQVISYKENLDEMERKNLCPYCKTELVLRNGKNGEFYGCKNYPKCRFTRKK